MNVQDEIKDLRSKGVSIWSHSKLSTFHNCQYEWHQTYNKKQRGIENVYSSAGSHVHSFIESVYRDEKDKSNFSLEFSEYMAELEFLGIDFPSEQIRDNFLADMKHYCEHFKKLDGRYLLEKQFLTKVGEHYFQGFIDMINVNDVLDENGEKVGNTIDVIDWKTSSKFSGKEKLKSSGNQLVMYKMALEDNGKTKIDSVKWCMLKYIHVCHTQKNGKIKYKMCSRRKWVKEMESAFKKDMLASGMDDLLVNMLLEEAIENNNIDNLPDVIKEKYWTEDCYVEYVVDDEKIEEFVNYVNDTIAEIESKDKNNDDEWKPVDFEKDSFYCNHLCGFRESCKFLKEYKAQFAKNKENAFSESSNGEITLDDLFNL